MASRKYNYKDGYGQFSKYYTGSESSTAIVAGFGRIAGAHLRSLTASAGNTFTFTLHDGSSSDGAVIFSSLNVGVGYHQLPYIEVDIGIFVDIAADASASATGIQHSVFYIKDE